MWKFAGTNRRSVILFIFLFVIANAIGTVEPLIIGKVLNIIQEQGVKQDNIYVILAFLTLFLAQELGFWIFHGYGRILENKTSFIVRKNFKAYMLEGTMNLPIEWHVDHHSGDTIDKIEKGAEALSSFASRTFELIQSVIFLITAYVVIMFYEPAATAFLIIATAIAFYILIRFDRVLVPGYRIVNRLDNKISAKIFDTISNITTVITLRIKSPVLDSIIAHMEEPFSQYNTNNIRNEQKWFSASVIGRLSVVLILSGYVYFNFKAGNMILSGTIYILYSYVNQVRETFYRFAYLYGDIIRQRTSLMNSEEISKEFAEQVHVPPALLPKEWSSIEIRNLSFSYHREDGAMRHLDEISMRISKGEKIAVIGESGGGKSTFLKVFRDLYHPKSIDLAIDGAKEGGGFSAISDSISLVPQDPEIFSTTIRENITMGVDYSEQHIEVFTDMARFTDIVKRLPKKLDSSIVEKGVNLSGGEKQRLALSRGLLASIDKEIILLDEPTSSVDFHNELAIYKNIFTAFEGKTVISSIHRLHLLSLFDTVYFFKDGRIIASGSLAELQASSPDFQMLWQKYIKTRDAAAE